jgi:hypothetical protein
MAALAFTTASHVRASAFRSKVLNLANTCSIGLRSGEYFGRKTRRAPTEKSWRGRWLLVYDHASTALADFMADHGLDLEFAAGLRPKSIDPVLSKAIQRPSVTRATSAHLMCRNIVFLTQPSRGDQHFPFHKPFRTLDGSR